MAGCFRSPKKYTKVLKGDSDDENVILLGDELRHKKVVEDLGKKELEEKTKQDLKDSKKTQKDTDTKKKDKLKKAEKKQKS